MAYISKNDLKMVTFMNRKYIDYKVNFKFYDDYVIWLYESLCNYDECKYYEQLEKDIEEYSDFQTGKKREKEGRLDGNWNED